MLLAQGATWASLQGRPNWQGSGWDWPRWRVLYTTWRFFFDWGKYTL